MKTNVNKLNAMNSMNANLETLNEQELRNVNGGEVTISYVIKNGQITVQIKKTK